MFVVCVLIGGHSCEPTNATARNCAAFDLSEKQFKILLGDLDMIDLKAEAKRIGKLGGAWQSIEREVIALCTRYANEKVEAAAVRGFEQAKLVINTKHYSLLQKAACIAAAIRASKEKEG